MMTAHQRETEFLKQCIRYDDTEERHRLEERITQIHRDERCVRRAVWLMALLAGLSMAGLGYAAVFMAEYPLNVPQLITRFLIKALCALGAGSLVCLFVFLGLGVLLRKDLQHRREDCRRLALKVFESRLGQPGVSPSEIATERERIAVVAAPKTGKLPFEAGGSPNPLPRALAGGGVVSMISIPLESEMNIKTEGVGMFKTPANNEQTVKDFHEHK